MHNLKVKILTAAMTAITAVSPVLSSYTAFASDITVNDDGTVTQVSTSINDSKDETEETKFLFINLKTAGGQIIINEGEEQEETIRLDNQLDGKDSINVYDKDGMLVSSEDANDNKYIYVYEAKADDAVNVKAKANDGYEIKQYSLTDDSSGTEMEEDTGFESKISAFKYPVFMDNDKTLKIEFEKKESADESDEDLTVGDATSDATSDAASDTTDNSEDIVIKDDEDNDITIADENNKDNDSDNDDKIISDVDANENPNVVDSNESSDNNNIAEDLTVGDNGDNNAGGEEAAGEDGETQDGQTDEITDSNNNIDEDNVANNIDNSDIVDDELVFDIDGNLISGVIADSDENAVSIKSENGGAIEIYNSDTYLTSIGYTETKSEKIAVKNGDKLTFDAIPDTNYTFESLIVTDADTGEELTPIEDEDIKDTEEQNISDSKSSDKSDNDNVLNSFTYEITSDVNVVASFTEEKQPEDEKEANNNNIIADAAIEEYVKENADPEYTSVDEIDLVNAMLIKNMLVDESALDSEHNDIDSIMLSGDIVKYWMGTLDSTVSVYELSEDSDYFVAYADTMHKDGQMSVSDVQVANHNDNGESLSGWHYDYNTGMIYIPKTCFYDGDKIMIGKVQTELMQNVKTNQAGEVTSTVKTTVVNGDDVSNKDVSVENTNVYDSTYTTTIENDLNKDNMTVSVNGIPTDAYNYNSSTGELTVGMSPSSIQSINVDTADESLVDKLAESTGLKAITTYADSAKVSLDKMGYASTTPITAQLSKLKIGNYMRMEATDGAKMRYVSNSSDSADTMGYLSADYDYVDNTAQYVISRSNKISTVFKYTSYTEKNLMLDLSSLDWNGLIDFDGLPNGKDGEHYSGGMYCGHITTKWGYSLPAAENVWYSSRYALGMRILDLNATASIPYVTIAICTQQMNSQNAVGIFRFKVKPLTGGIKLDKRLAYASFSAKFSNLRIDTTFQLYSDSACTKKVGNEIVVKASRNTATKSVIIDGIKPGIYYLQETGVCNGCKRNVQKYEVRVTAGGEPSTSFKSLTTKETHSFIKNEPYYFQGKILHKYDESNNTGIADVIFRVEYWNRLKTKDGAKREGVWYLKSDENGDIEYDSDHLVPDSELHKKIGKNVNNDDVAMLTEKKWGFPYGQLYIYEVYAPEGYKFDKNKEYNIQLTKPNETETVLAQPIKSINVGNPPTGGFLLGKFLYEKTNFSNLTPRIYIDTKFGIYKNYNAKTEEVSGELMQVEFKCDSDTMSETKLIQGLAPGTYYLKELGKCPGTIQNTNVYSFEVKNGQTTNHIQNVKTGREGTKVGNTPYRFQGKILTKVNGEGEGLAGAIFRVTYATYKHSDPNSQDLFTWYFQSLEDGSVSYDEQHYVGSWNGNVSDDPFKLDDGTWALPSGCLYVQEVEAPTKDFAVDDTEYEVYLHGKKDGNNLYTIKDLYVDNLEVVNDQGERWKVRVNLKKVDENGNGLEGAVFNIFDSEELKKPIETLTSQDDGTSEIKTILLSSNKDNVTLYCQEDTPPNGYTRDDTVYKLTFNQNTFKTEQEKDASYPGELKTFGPETGIPNTKGWPVRVKAKKVDGNGTPLAGATFTVYEDANCQKEIGTMTSDESGDTNILSFTYNNDTKSAKLYAKETGIPEGYTADKNKVYEVEFTKDDYDKLSEEDKKIGELKSFGGETGIINMTPTPSITPGSPSEAGLHVKKISNASDDIMDLSSYTLKGAEFEVTSSRDGYMGTLVTDENGYSNTLALPDNSIPHHEDEVRDTKDNTIITPARDWIEPVTTTYYITEKTPPHWHKKNYSTKSITVTMPGAANSVQEVTFDDEPKFCKNEFELEKLGVKGEYIKGAVFKVEYYDADDGDDQKSGDGLVDDVSGTLSRTWYLKSDENGRIRLNENYLDPDNQSDAFFKHNNQVVIPIGGYLKITEINAPAEYEVEDKPVCIQCNENTDFKLTYANSRAWYDEYQRCRINLKKYDTDGTTPISGVEFEIKFVKQAITPTSKMHPNFKRLLKEGETLKRNTDENGEVYFDNLDQGTYEITETKTLPGMALLRDKITVTVPMTMTNEEANEYGNVNYETAKEDVGYTNKWYFYECTFEIINNHLFTPVPTGGDGDWKYGFAGFTLIMATASVIIIKKRKRKK